MRNLSMRWKATLASITLIVSITALFLGLYYQDARDRIRQQYVEKARSIVLTAESTREEMAAKWDAGIFSNELLSAWARAGELNKILAAVPVVTAWRAAQAKSEEGGYEFRVPKFHPRNPKNEPDEIEAAALRLLESGDVPEHTVIDHDQNAVRYFRPVKLTQDCMACHGDPAQSVTLWHNEEGLDPTGAKMENWKVGEVHGAFEVVQSLDQADAALAGAMWRGVGIAAVIAAIAMLLTRVIVSRAVLKPLAELNHVADAISAGDLRPRVNVRSNDELGALGKAFNVAADALTSLVNDILRSAVTLGSASSENSVVATQLLDGAQRNSTRSASVAAAAEEMATNMSTMATSTDQVTESVKSVAHAVDEMKTTITEVARSAEKAATVADQATQLSNAGNATVAQLGSAADEIGNVINTIQEIAEQTNLLALNATIEAARAGDAGKGFAVVATEVKELARQTADATVDIRQRIEGIQSSTSTVVDSLSGISEVIEEVNQLSRTIAAAVEEQSVTTQGISDSSQQTSIAAEAVSANIAETASATTEVTSNIADVDALAKDTSAWARKMRNANAEVVTLVDQLRERALAYKTSSRGFHADPIKAAHMRWKMRLAQLLAGEAQLSVSEISDHRACEFGKWYFGDGTAQFGALPEFKAIDAHHAQVHALAREITEKFNAGDVGAATEKFRELSAVADRLCTALDELERATRAQSETAKRA